MATTVWALDFDGVLVDSARETGIAGWKTLGALLRKEPFVSAAPQASIDAFVLARPVLETGWEAALMLWLIAAEGVSGEALLSSFQVSLKERALAGLGLAKEQVMEAFHNARSTWIETEQEDWLASHGFYATAVAAAVALVAAEQQVYIVTTKSAEFATRLLAFAGIHLPQSRIFGLGSGKKYDTLGKLLRETGAERAFFLEDRLAALSDVQAKGSDDVKRCTTLALADWGYNLQTQREQARGLDMTVLDEDEFLQLATAAAVQPPPPPQPQPQQPQQQQQQPQ